MHLLRQAALKHLYLLLPFGRSLLLCRPPVALSVDVYVVHIFHAFGQMWKNYLYTLIVIIKLFVIKCNLM